MAKPVIVWFRRDLRLQDNPALTAAQASGAPLIPLYIHDEEAEGRWAAGGATRWWLHHSLTALGESLRTRGARLILRAGAAEDVLREICAECDADVIYWNRRYEPAIIARDKRLKASLVNDGLEAKSFNAALLFEPHTVQNKQGKPFQVFTPYWRHCLTLPVQAPVAFGKGDFTAPTRWPKSAVLADFALLPKLDWADGFAAHWQPGEAGAQSRMKTFLNGAVDDYEAQRNTPSLDGSSRLSPWLHFGEISPRQIWAALKARSRDSGVFPASAGARVFLSEVGWREFAYHLLYHFPTTPESPLREDFENFPWAEDAGGKKLTAWQRGQTGYPIVDAGMRQLWHTGWMHNRVRMIVASFLVKHLRLPWQRGAEWFWDTLVDADLANNTLGWQWSAGCGADAAPYFRIFAPVTQGERFDGPGDYVRRWVPELAQLPAKWIQRPWEAPADVLENAGVRLGVTYPTPMVDHAKARAEALVAFKSMRGSGPEK